MLSNATIGQNRRLNLNTNSFRYACKCFGLTPAVSSRQPSIKFSEDYVNHRQVGFGLRLVALDDQRIMTVTELGQVAIAAPTISANDGVWCNRCENERFQLFLDTTRHHLKTELPYFTQVADVY